MRTQGSHRTCRRLFTGSSETPGGYRAVAVALSFLLLTPVAYRSQTGDYLSAEEIEDVRNSQKPHQRMSVLNDIFRRRMKGAVSSKESRVDPVKSSPSDSEKKRGGPGEIPGPRSFTGWMEEVVMCLEEIETNLENYPVDQPLNVWDLETGAPIRMNPKKFRKALKKLRSSLLEFNQWLLDRFNQLRGSESRIAGESADFLADLAEELKEIIELAGGKVSEKEPAENVARE